MKNKEINKFSRFLNEDAEGLEEIISKNEQLRLIVDKELPASVHRSKAYQRAKARGLVSESNYLKSHYFLDRDVKTAIGYLDNQIEDLRHNSLVPKIVHAKFPYFGWSLLISFIVLIFSVIILR